MPGRDVQVRAVPGSAREGRTGSGSVGQGRAGSGRVGRAIKGRSLMDTGQGWVEDDETWHGQQNRTGAGRQCKFTVGNNLSSWINTNRKFQKR